MSSAPDMPCRICGSPKTRRVGEVEYIKGYRTTVQDCDECGCRFTCHDQSVHDAFHKTGAISYYDDYRVLARECKRYFDQKDIQGLRNLLNEAKYRFVLDELSQLPRAARLLEAGCSRGYLTSWFICGGWDIVGVDVSAEALESARADFGGHFILAGAPEIKARAPYDAIYHVGMIGCVSDPVKMTRELLSLLKPSGILCFNAPNRDACIIKDQLWLDSAPPPDVVTLFPAGFWTKQFEAEAIVREGVSYLDPDLAFPLRLRRMLGDHWHPPTPQERHDSYRSKSAAPASTAGRLRQWLTRAVGMLARVTGLSRLVSRCPGEFGLYVKMRPRTQKSA